MVSITQTYYIVSKYKIWTFKTSQVSHIYRCASTPQELKIQIYKLKSLEIMHDYSHLNFKVANGENKREEEEKKRGYDVPSWAFQASHLALPVKSIIPGLAVLVSPTVA